MYTPAKDLRFALLFCSFGFLLCQLTSIIALGAFSPLRPIYDEKTTTLGAGVGEGFPISGKLAIWIITTAIEDTLLFT